MYTGDPFRELDFADKNRPGKGDCLRCAPESEAASHFTESNGKNEASWQAREPLGRSQPW